MDKPLLTIKNLIVQRSSSFALEIPALEVFPGQVVCVTGANGSGKTTLLEAITGLIKPDKGTLALAGFTHKADSLSLKRNLGYIPDDDNWIIPELTAREYFALLASVYKEAGARGNMQARIDILARKLLFTSFDQQVGSLSHGNRKKVQIIGGLLHNPPLLVIDELRNGLDPIAIIQAEALLKSLSRQGMAIVAATHDLWWSERFAKDIVMIGRGKVILQASTKLIVRQAGSVEARFIQLYQEGDTDG